MQRLEFSLLFLHCVFFLAGLSDFWPHQRTQGVAVTFVLFPLLS